MSHILHSNIRIDNFQFMRNDLTQYCFFLSHCHEDHIMGLNSSWNYGKIYASHISASLIVDRFPNLKEFVVSAIYFDSILIVLIMFRYLWRWMKNIGYIWMIQRRKESRQSSWTQCIVLELSCSCSREKWVRFCILVISDFTLKCLSILCCAHLRREMIK